MIGTYSFKYHGVLKNFDLQKINKHTFQLLIEAKIFDVKELPKTFGFEDDFIDIDMEIYYNAWDCYIINDVEYNLKLEVWEDIFDYCEFKSESHDKLAQKIRDLEFNIDTYVSNHSKIKYLKQVIYDIKNQIIDRDYYLLYTKNIKVDGYDSWFEFFSLGQTGDEDFTYIFQYLQGEYDFVPPFIKSLWTNCYYAKDLIHFCTKRILNLEKTSGINEVDVSIDIYAKSRINYLLSENLQAEKEYHDIRLDIFKDQKSRIAFDLILSEWKEEKNTAFYSKVFKFLQLKGYIILEEDDSDEYRKFILSNSKLKSFTRIQKQTSKKLNNIWDRSFSDFEKYLKNFTQNFE
jgi:hypothetical protein